MIIYVLTKFQQNQESDDYVISNNRQIAKIEASDEGFYDEWRITDETVISGYEAEITTRQSAELERGIYQQYSLEEQTQDTVTLQRCLLRLKAAGIEDSESRIVTASDSVLASEVAFDDALETASVGLSDENIALMTKAIKCFMKSVWVEKAIEEYDGTELTELPIV